MKNLEPGIRFNVCRLGSMLVFICLFFSACTNLRHVSEFSANAITSLGQYENLDYGFEQSCLDNCLERKIETFDLEMNCSCDGDQKADSVTFLLYQNLMTYFRGLNRLAANELTRFNTSGITAGIQEGNFGSINMNRQQVSAFVDLGQVLTNSVTGNYRKSKLKAYVKEADPAVQELLGFLRFNLSDNLTQKVRAQQLLLKDNYFFLLREPSLSELEKRSATGEYYERIRNLEGNNREIKVYTSLLEKLADGHRELAENIDRMKFSDLQSLMFGYAEDLTQLHQVLNKVTP
ncbi:hypothetical protein [Pararhodonellum marinum]|uniref:hypothetical protein n=1 Tax=Pararhodonellum marinum TaxID=2755358 RepID=UPI00189044D6|nr:hypothetical protein [Pararhodonellum marinum]